MTKDEVTKLVAKLRIAAQDLADQDNRMSGQGESPRKKEDTYYWIAADALEELTS